MSLQNKIPHQTEFHRNRSAFKALEEKIIPSFTTFPIAIASIGCSDGREAYSVLLQHWADRDRLRIAGYDIDQNVINVAKNSEYEIGYEFEEYKWIRSLNIHEGEAYTEKIFWRYDMKTAKISMSKDAKKHTKFKRGNIQSGPIPGNYDIILALNLLYHFPETERGRILENIFVSLNKGGWLVCESDPSWMGCHGYAKWMKDITKFGFEKQTEIDSDFSQVYRKICQKPSSL